MGGIFTEALVVFEIESSGGKNEVVVRFSAASFNSVGVIVSQSTQLWQLPDGKKVTRRAFAKHKIATQHTKHGLNALDQLDLVDALLKNFKERGLQVVAHDGKRVTRLLEQTAVAHMADWTLPYPITCLKTISTRILNLKGKASHAPRPPTATELFRYLHKQPCKLSETEPSESMNLTALNFLAAQKRGWIR